MVATVQRHYQIIDNMTQKTNFTGDSTVVKILDDEDATALCDPNQLRPVTISKI